MKNGMLIFTMGIFFYGCGAPYFGSNPDPAYLNGASTGCKAPPIQQNIIGTWNFVSTQDTETRTGSISFDRNNNVIDTDTLFSNYRIGTPNQIVSRLYSVETDTSGTYKNFGELFWIRIYTKGRDGLTHYSEGDFYKIAMNECKKIELKVPGSSTIIVLTR